MLKLVKIKNMKIGTIGAGRIAKAFTKHVAAAGHDIVMSNKTGDSLDSIVKEFGPNVKAGSLKQVLDAEIILLSIPWTEVTVFLSSVKSWNGQIIIDTTNAVSFPDFKPLDLGGKTSSELVAELARGAKVVKAFNTFAAATLASDPRECGGNRVIFISGDDEAAKKKVLNLLKELGFAGVDLGNLAAGKAQQPGGPLSGKNFIQLNNN
jgi:8-hydroxy-5-deazaflavin:NADPH oxidoreductase